MLAADRRAEERNRVDIPAYLTDLYRERLPVQVLNASRSGLGLKVEDRFTVGFPVLVECEGLLVIGNVRHCRPAVEGGYLLGIKVDKIINAGMTNGRVV